MTPDQKRNLINRALEQDYIAQTAKSCALVRSLMESDKNLDTCLEIVADIRNSVSTLSSETRKWAADTASNWEKALFVTLTFKPESNRYQPSSDEHHWRFNEFKKLLSLAVYKNAYRRYGKAVEMFSVTGGDEMIRTHIHCYIRVPERFIPDTFEFESLIRKYWGWGSVDIGDCDDNHNRIIGYLLRNNSTVNKTRQCLI